MTQPYLAHFALKEPPFSKEIPDGELWLPSSKLATVEALLEALDERASVVLVGEPGVGKTCVLRALRHRIPAAGYRLTYCHNATLGRRDFYRQLCHAVGLDPGLGMLHQAGFGKPALALDLIEAFRSIIVDSVVITMVNTGQVSPNDFENQLGAYRLRDDARRTFIQKLEARLDEKIKHPLFGYNVSYRRSIELQARIFAKYAQGEIAEYRSFIVR